MEAVLSTVENKTLNKVRPVVVISSNSQAGGIIKAKNHGIKTEVIERKKFPSLEEFGKALLEILIKNDTDFISQNGWMLLTPGNVIQKFSGRVINQHPGPLDPGYHDFGGKHMFGASRVTAARLAYIALTHDDLWTESTVHYVSEEYDMGRLIQVKPLGVKKALFVENIAELSEKSALLIKKTLEVQKELLPLEHENVIEVLQELADGKKPFYERQHRLIPEANIAILEQAKKLAIELFP